MAVPRSRGPQEVANSPQHKTFTNPFFQSGPGTLFNNLVFEVDDQDSQVGCLGDMAPGGSGRICSAQGMNHGGLSLL